MPWRASCSREQNNDLEWHLTVLDYPAVTDIFKGEPIAHNFRSALFQTIVATSDVVDNNRELSPLAGDAKDSRRLQRACLEEAETKILKFLTSVCRPEDVERIRSLPGSGVPQMAKTALELALQFGVHPGELIIQNPRVKAPLSPGMEFRVEGEVRRDATGDVALVLSPGLARLEGGEMVTIVPCNLVFF
jgi:hypothetical protein